MNVQELYLTRRNEFIQLLPRDWELLSFLEQQGFATFTQLEGRYFNNRQNCSARLLRLKKFGYIDDIPALDLFLSKKDQLDGKLFPYISEFTLKPATKIYFLSEDFRRKFAFSEGLLKKNMVLHQLILNDLRAQLESEIPHKMVLHDPKIKIVAKIETGRHESIRPDLSLEFGTFKVAIELERTIKNKSRYYERFLYYEDSVYSHVLYYTTDRRKIEFLIERSNPYRKVAVGYFREPFELYHNIFGNINIQEFFRKSQEG